MGRILVLTIAIVSVCAVSSILLISAVSDGSEDDGTIQSVIVSQDEG